MGVFHQYLSLREKKRMNKLQADYNPNWIAKYPHCQFFDPSGKCRRKYSLLHIRISGSRYHFLDLGQEFIVQQAICFVQYQVSNAVARQVTQHRKAFRRTCSARGYLAGLQKRDAVEYQ